MGLFDPVVIKASCWKCGTEVTLPKSRRQIFYWTCATEGCGCYQYIQGRKSADRDGHYIGTPVTVSSSERTEVRSKGV